MPDFSSIFQNPAFVFGTSLLGGGKNGMQTATQALQAMQQLKLQRDQQAQMMDYHNRQLLELQQQHAAENAYHNRLADTDQGRLGVQQGTLEEQRAAHAAEQANAARLAAVAEGNLGVNQTHADLYKAQAGLANQKTQQEIDAEKAFNEQTMPALQNWLAKQGMGGQPAAPTGVTQQLMQPPQQPGVDPTQMPPAGLGAPMPSMGGPAPSMPMAPAGMKPTGPSPVFMDADKFVSGIEGGYTSNDAGSGPTNFGINQKANPDVDVKSLTPDSAAQLRKTRYWDAIGGDNLPPATAMVAYDAAINQGVGYAQKLLQTTDGNPALMIQQRKSDYENLAKQPKFAGQLEGWKNRLAGLSAQVEGASQAAPQVVAGATNPATPPTAAAGMSADQQMRVIGAMQLMRDPATRAAGMKELAEAVTPKFAAPGSIDIRTGQALPNPALAETSRHNKVEEGFAGNKDIRETVKAGQELAKFPGELQQQGATLAETQAKIPEIQARTAQTQAATERTKQETANTNASQEQAILSLNQSLDSLDKSYQKLDQLGAITNTDKGSVENIMRHFTQQTKGGSLGKVMGSEVANELSNIQMTKPMLLASIMHSTGIKSTQMNSDKELNFYVSSATDPSLSLQANQQAIQRLRGYTNWARQHQQETNPSFARYLADTGGSVPTPGTGGTSEKKPMSYEDFKKLQGGK
jgi:hypothetical protein